MQERIPERDPSFDDWQRVLVNGCRTNQIALGLNANDIANLLEHQEEWEERYLKTVQARAAFRAAAAQKAAARKRFVAQIRRLIRTLRARLGTNDAILAQLGLKPLERSHRPRPGPTTAPLLTVDGRDPARHGLAFRDSATPDRRGKPAGMVGVEVWRAVVAAGTDPGEEAFRLLGVATRSPHAVPARAEDAGLIAHYRVRWLGTRGRTGPFSEVARVVVSPLG
ncbi:MAG: hypothetical protein KIS66_06700 [Fimbriimonadaceae bacterium]|nr:hypothetical protein [Fimbriimonadaceae bacterium]